MSKVLVRGPALSNSGYGEHCRSLLRYLSSTEHEVYLINVNWGTSGWIIETGAERDWIDELIMSTAKKVRSGDADFDISFQVQLPSEWQKLAPFNIGVTAGSESTSVSDSWNLAAKEVDAVIVPSNHAKNSFSEEYRDKISVVPFCTRTVETEEMNLGLNTGFNFLTIAQWSPRKNIEQCIYAFMQEFQNEDVGLVLKLNYQGNSNIDRQYIKEGMSRLVSSVDSKCKVYLLHGNLRESQIRGLYENSNINSYVSTSRGEGFGLPLFEAAQSGLPVVTPYWSGVCDFLSKENITEIEYDMVQVGEDNAQNMMNPESSWCEASVESIKSALREAYVNAGDKLVLAREQSESIKNNFTEQNVNKLYNSIVNEFLKKGEQNEAK